jgi:hypothetical protein
MLVAVSPAVCPVQDLVDSTSGDDVACLAAEVVSRVQTYLHLQKETKELNQALTGTCILTLSTVQPVLVVSFSTGDSVTIDVPLEYSAEPAPRRFRVHTHSAGLATRVHALQSVRVARYVARGCVCHIH